MRQVAIVAVDIAERRWLENEFLCCEAEEVRLTYGHQKSSLVLSPAGSPRLEIDSKPANSDGRMLVRHVSAFPLKTLEALLGRGEHPLSHEEREIGQFQAVV